MVVKRRRFIQAAAGAACAAAAQDAAGEGAEDGKARPDGRNDPGRTTKRGEDLLHVPWTRRLPVRYEADVAVIGGGIAGVSAACAAARSGAKTLLVERFAVAGGTLTSGGVANFCGDVTGQGEVFDRILADLAAWGAIDLPRTVFDHEILAVVLQEMLLRRGVKLLLHTRFVDVRERGGRISECVVSGKSGPEALRAKQFIDCAGACVPLPTRRISVRSADRSPISVGAGARACALPRPAPAPTVWAGTGTRPCNSSFSLRRL